jgi:hypothetical protein
MIGCACCAGAGYYAVAGGPDATQIVHKDPISVYSAMAAGLDNAEETGMITNGAGNMLSYEIKVHKTAGKAIDVNLTIDNEAAGEAHFGFTPAKGGTETVMTGDIDVDQHVLSRAFAGTPNDRIAEIPDFAYRVALHKVLADVAEKIEAGDPVLNLKSSASDAAIPSAAGMSGSPDRWEQRRRQAMATRPMTDPNADARKYLDPYKYR